MKEYVGKRVKIIAKVHGIIYRDKNGVGRLILEDIIVNGTYEKDHGWVKLTKSFTNAGIVTGDIFTATALVYEYMDINDITKTKLGFKTIRAVKVC